tara:strand:- start:1063 stop:1428 length:366 start_codon:yes stop_codon:yes gene_type:complete
MSDTLTPRTDEALDSIKLRLRGISILDTFVLSELSRQLERESVGKSKTIENLETDMLQLDRELQGANERCVIYRDVVLTQGDTIRDLLSEANGLKEQLNVACTDAAFLDSYHKKATSGGAK